MHRARVVVVRLSLFNMSFVLGCWLIVASALYSVTAYSQGQISHVASPTSLLEGANYLARIGHDDPAELEQALDRIEQLFMIESGGVEYEPIVIVLHGPEVAIFQSQNYRQYKHIVDRAARLTAFNVVDIRVCETRLGVLGSEPEALVPFVGTVPYGLAEIERLTKVEGYLQF